MESAWLLTAGLVPVVFAPADLMVFVDLPKIALLQTLTGAMAALWAADWALTGNKPAGAANAPTWHRFRSWTRENPARWAIVAALAFLAANAISTLLSPAPSLSLWGNNPGRDGYGLYNTASLVVLFLVVATRLRTRAQTWRLLTTIAVAATLAALYGVLQYYRLDPFGQSDAGRITASFGNSLFAGSFLSMALPISLGLATARVSSFGWATGGLATRRNRLTILLGMGWVAAVAVQLTAIILTLSRGPWTALAVGLPVWLLLLALTAGRGAFTRGLLLLGVAVVVAVATLLALPTPGGTGASGAASALDRVATIPGEVSARGISGRLSLWRRSASVIAERPWFDDGAHAPLAFRHLFGYGPEIFRYALPLRWAPDALEPVNASAHNRLVHLTVELGPVGVASYVALLAVLVLGAVKALRLRRERLPVGLRMLYAALLASMAVRVVEQMTGVARVSDLTLFWAIAALMAAVPAETAVARPREAPGRARGRTRASTSFWRWGIALRVFGAMTVLVWEKNVPYVRAGLLGSDAVRSFNRGELGLGLDQMDAAIVLAPDVAFYYTTRAEMMDAFTTLDAAAEIEVATLQHRLTMRAVDANPLSHSVRLAAATSAVKLAGLGDRKGGEDAVILYEELLRTLPGFEPVYNGMAWAQLVLGRPAEALHVLESYTEVSGPDARPSVDGLFLRGEAYRALGQREDAVRTLKRYLELSPAGQYAAPARRSLGLLLSEVDGSG
jgi:O-antigen ligase